MNLQQISARKQESGEKRRDDERSTDLHERVEDLGGRELVLQAPHDLAALLHARDRCPPRDV